MLRTSPQGQDNTDIARRNFEAFNKRDYDLLLSLASDDVESLDVPTGQVLKGLKGYRESAEQWIKAFPDASADITNIVSSGDYVVVEFTGRGTHNGPMMTPGGEVPPTGRRIEIPFVEVHEIRNGKIVRSRLYYDMSSFARQLGLTA
jgi:steroid delta-isomerase-like uncharacterized protein